jgi:hypothetical protein
MYGSFLSNGSILSVVLMEYTICVMLEAMRLYTIHKAHFPLLDHPLAILFMLGATPCTIWPAIYIGTFSGLTGGIIAWFLLQIIGMAATFLLGIRGSLIGVHYVIACIVYPIGYYLSFTTPSPI